MQPAPAAFPRTCRPIGGAPDRREGGRDRVARGEGPLPRPPSRPPRCACRHGNLSLTPEQVPRSPHARRRDAPAGERRPRPAPTPRGDRARHQADPPAGPVEPVPPGSPPGLASRGPRPVAVLPTDEAPPAVGLVRIRGVVRSAGGDGASANRNDRVRTARPDRAEAVRSRRAPQGEPPPRGRPATLGDASDVARPSRPAPRRIAPRVDRERGTPPDPTSGSCWEGVKRNRGVPQRYFEARAGKASIGTRHRPNRPRGDPP